MYLESCIILLCLGLFHNSAMELNAAGDNFHNRNESTSNDPDDEIIVVGSSKSNEIRYFNPVDEFWQSSMCIQLQVQLENYLKSNQTVKVLNSPSQWVEVKPDGNCFYRALSYWVSGTENHHHTIRKRVVEIIKTDQRIFNFLGEENVDTYLSSLSTNSWTTEVEIIASTLLLNTPIYVYSQSRHTWYLFDQNKKSKSSLTKADKCIYIQHITDQHYNLVTDVISDQVPEHIRLDSKRTLVKIPEKDIRHYHPVNSLWQLQKCQKMNLLLENPIQNDQTPKSLNYPKKCIQVQNDKNSFFRALSYWVTGTEDNHKIIRQKVSEEIFFNLALQALYKKDESVSLMRQNDWATKIEIMASAIFLETSIFIYENERQEWDFYNKNFTDEYVPVNTLTEKCIYLKEISPNEFVVVEEIEDFI